MAAWAETHRPKVVNRVCENSVVPDFEEISNYMRLEGGAALLNNLGCRGGTNAVIELFALHALRLLHLLLLMLRLRLLGPLSLVDPLVAGLRFHAGNVDHRGSTFNVR